MNTIPLERKKKYLIRAFAVELISCACALLFLYAAVNKLIDHEKFKVQLEQSPLLTNFASVITWLIPMAEIAIAVLLVFPRTLLLGLYATFGLMVMFSAYIVVILNFSSYVPCSCGGILEKMGWATHLLFNMGFVILPFSAILMKIRDIR